MGPSPSHPAEPLTLQQELPATVESVSEARHAVRRFAAELDVDLDGVTLAVSEAVANVVTHAYEADAGGVIELSGTATPYEVRIIVRDRGHGIAAARPSTGAGFGIGIIRRLAEHVSLDDSPSGVVLTMRFRRGGRSSAR